MTEEQQPAAGEEEAREKAQDQSQGDAESSVEQEDEKLKEEMKKLEEDPPEKIEDWPDDERKYETFGGPEGEHSYDEGPEAQLGPSSLRRHEDGRVEIEGEEVDNPDEYKTDPIEGSTQSLVGGADDGEDSDGDSGEDKKEDKES
jgi:hypothetical protein